MEDWNFLSLSISRWILSFSKHMFSLKAEVSHTVWPLKNNDSVAGVFLKFIFISLQYLALISVPVVSRNVFI